MILDGDGVKVTCKLCGAIVCSAPGRCRVLEKADIRDADGSEHSAGKITVYYPTASDTLFSVAKRFRVPLEDLADDNGISVPTSAAGGDISLAGVERIVIS